jgi:hypothetical protein
MEVEPMGTGLVKVAWTQPSEQLEAACEWALGLREKCARQQDALNDSAQLSRRCVRPFRAPDKRHLKQAGVRQGPRLHH